MVAGYTSLHLRASGVRPAAMSGPAHATAAGGPFAGWPESSATELEPPPRNPARRHAPAPRGRARAHLGDPPRPRASGSAFHRHVLDYVWTCVSGGSAISHGGERQHERRDATRRRDPQASRSGAGESMIHDLVNSGDEDIVFTTIEYLQSADEPLTARTTHCRPDGGTAGEAGAVRLPRAGDRRGGRRLLARGDGVRVLAGGQSLVPLMKFRTAKPRALVDVNGVPGPRRDRGARRRAARRRARAPAGAARGRARRRALAAVAEAVRYVGYLATRHRGTVGGSLAYAAPWAELTAACRRARRDDRGRARRAASGTIAARAFFRGPHETALEPGELITAVELPGAAAAHGRRASTR